MSGNRGTLFLARLWTTRGAHPSSRRWSSRGSAHYHLWHTLVAGFKPFGEDTTGPTRGIGKATPVQQEHPKQQQIRERMPQGLASSGIALGRHMAGDYYSPHTNARQQTYTRERNTQSRMVYGCIGPCPNTLNQTRTIGEASSPKEGPERESHGLPCLYRAVDGLDIMSFGGKPQGRIYSHMPRHMRANKKADGTSYPCPTSHILAARKGQTGPPLRPYGGGLQTSHNTTRAHALKRQG